MTQMHDAGLGTMNTGQTAREIYQAFLDVTTGFVRSGDVESYQPFVHLPSAYRTGAGVAVVETPDELAEDILKITAWLRASGVTDYYRIATGARFVGANRIEGFHKTYALNGALPVIEPYENRALLQWNGVVWQVLVAEHELSAELFVDRAVRAAPGVFSDKWSHQPSGAKIDQSLALARYQSLIRRMDDAMNRRDFEGWQKQFTMPYQVHYATVDHVVGDSNQDPREFFDTARALLDDPSTEKIERSASYAAFAAEDRLVGYHETRMVGGGETQFGPIKSRMIFVLDAGIWKCTSVTNSLSNEGFLDGPFKPSPAFPTLREVQGRTKQ